MFQFSSLHFFQFYNWLTFWRNEVQVPSKYVYTSDDCIGAVMETTQRWAISVALYCTYLFI